MIIPTRWPPAYVKVKHQHLWCSQSQKFRFADVPFYLILHCHCGSFERSSLLMAMTLKIPTNLSRVRCAKEGSATRKPSAVSRTLQCIVCSVAVGQTVQSTLLLGRQSFCSLHMSHDGSYITLLFMCPVSQVSSPLICSRSSPPGARRDGGRAGWATS